MSKITAFERFHLRKFIKELEQFRAPHTEFVSVYIPTGYDLDKIINHLKQEQGTATNIKSAITKKNVIDALERMIQRLRLYAKTPKNGLAIFAGNIAAREGKTDVKVWDIEPVVPIATRIYRCDKMFHLDILKDLCETKDFYGLLVMDARDAIIALLKGKSIVPLAKIHSHIPGKMKAGGQCLDPKTNIETPKGVIKLNDLKKGDFVKSFDFEKNMLIDSEILDFWKVKKEQYLIIKTEKSQLITSKDHLFFIGKNSTKAAEELTTSDQLLNENGYKIRIKSIEQKNKEIELIDISVKDQNFIANGLIVHNSALRFSHNRDLAIKEHMKKTAELMKDQFLKMSDLKGILVGGPGPIKYELVDSNFITGDIKKKILTIKDLSYTENVGLQELVDKCVDVLAEEEIAEEKKIVGLFLEKLARHPELVAYGEPNVRKALEMGAVDILLLSESLDEKTIDELEDIASQFNSSVKIISTETREGVQLRDLGKVSAMLRFAI